MMLMLTRVSGPGHDTPYQIYSFTLYYNPEFWVLLSIRIINCWM
jgi:hypothetical protein